MFCTNCGLSQRDSDAFCSRCGKPSGAATASAPPPPPRAGRRLARRMAEKKVAGVCAGVAWYLNADVTLVRVLWLVIAISTIVPGFLAYLIAWIAMPKEYGSQPAPVAAVAAQT